jgi:hypothetical protein
VGETQVAPVIPLTSEAAEREELFPFLEGEDTPLTDEIHLIEKLRMARYYQDKKEKLEAQLQALIDRYSAWYGKRTQHCDERIAKHMTDIQNYMKERNLQKVPTPEGTPYFRNVTSFLWPDDENLIAWLKANAPELVETREVINKSAVKTYIHATGNAPPGYEEQTEPRLYVKDPQ